MSDHSTIEWTDATWNPVTGCSVTSPGCKGCYAMRLAGTRLRNHPSREGLTRPSAAGPVWTGETRFNAQWLDQPLQWARARRIFVCAHGDLFHPSVPDEWIDQVFAVMALAAHHTFQVLTKQAKRAAEYFAHPVREALIGQQVGRIHEARTGDPVAVWSGLPLANVWIGVSAEDQRRANERIPELLRIDAAVRFVSLEPLLGPIVLDPLWLRASPSAAYLAGKLTGDMPAWTRFGAFALDWVIVGGESGPTARPMHPDWVRSLRDHSLGAGVPFFLKQWGEWVDADNGPDADSAYEGKPGCWIDPDGTAHDGALGVDFMHGTYPMYRVGKKAAGRMLDGRVWEEEPR